MVVLFTHKHLNLPGLTVVLVKKQNKYIKSDKINAALTCKTSSTIGHSHGRYLDSSNTGVTNNLNNGCVLFCSGSATNVHAGSLTKLTSTYKCEPLLML